MSKWINKFLKNESMNLTDRTDKPIGEGHLSVLSALPEGLLDPNLENMSTQLTDRTDKPTGEGHLSVLSVTPQRFLNRNLKNTSRKITDNTDRFDPNMNMSGFPKKLFERIVSPYDEDDFEERIAIAEVDGNQNPLQAHRISYLDAFISLLSALAENDPHQDWLAQKIQTALAILEAQNFPTLN